MHRTEDMPSKKSRKRIREDDQELVLEDIADEKEVKEEKPKRKRLRKKDEKDVSGAITQQPALDAFKPQQPIVAREFNSHDVDKLSVNEHFRYLGSSKKVGHAVVVKDEAGDDVALQFHIPAGEEKDTPQFRPLTAIEEIERFGMTRFRAHTPDGRTPMFATRFEDAEFDGEQLRIWNFSPGPKGKEPFWGSDKELEIFTKEALEDEEVKAELAEILKKGTKSKGGRELEIHAPSVPIRDAIPTRKPDQNTVMEESAKDAYEAFLNTWEDELSDDMKKVFDEAIKAPLNDMFKSQRRPEWLHAEGFGLTPMTMDPQRRDNLGAAGKWANTEMMVLERMVKWFAMNRPEAKEKIKPHFEMLLDSELIKKIYFQVSIEEQGHIIKLSQEINPLKRWPLFRRATDLVQGTAVAYSLLNEIEPVSKDVIKKGGETLRARKKEVKKPEGKDSEVKDTEVKKPGKLAEKKVVGKPVAEEKAPVVAPKQPAALQAALNKPTYLKHESSIVQVYTTSQEFDYDYPWRGGATGGSSGSGLVIEHEGKKFILTNAHCVENAAYMKVRLANDRKHKYEARIVNVAYQCDLAMLEVADPQFNAEAVPVQLGDMVNLGQQVMTAGFPMGGTEISISNGIASRIEVRDYCMSGLDMLQVQIDAAVNPGNSGGPVFSGDKVVGIAFQGYDRQGLGYMIPIPIIKHFVAETFNGKQFRGFPILPVDIQHLDNDYLREYYGMSPEQTGVRISKVDKMCDASDKLKVDDVLMEIDGLPISNEGTVNIPRVGDVIDFWHITHMKFIGENVKVKVLRKDPVSKQHKIIDLNIKMDTIPFDTNLIPQAEHDKTATFYINSGIIFEPVTRNYIDGKGAELEEVRILGEGSILEASKKEPGEQLVAINDILDCQETQGYGEFCSGSTTVKEINGKPIKHIHDVVVAMEANKEPVHVITTSGNSKIILKNMAQNEHEHLLKRYKIKTDRSDDLLPVAAAPALTTIVVPKPVRATTANVFQMFKKKEVESKPAPKEESAELLSDFEEVDDSESLEEPRELTRDQLPGLKRYQAALGAIEEKARSGFYDDAGYDEDEDMDFEDLGSKDSASAEDESEESSDEKNVKQRPVRKVASKPGLFSNKRKRDDEDEDEDEKSRAQKRPKK